MRNGYFVTVEGLDGCGKTTQLNLIKEYFINKGYEVIVVREPGGTQIGEQVRNILLDNKNKEMCEITEVLLYAASRAQIIQEVIKPDLQKGKVVLCDRFVDSSFVYQGKARGVGLNVIEKINELAIDNIYPDVTYYFNITPETSIKRREFKIADRIEQEDIEFHRKVHDGYIEISEKYKNRIIKIDADVDIETVFLEVKKHLDLLIKNK